MIVSNSLDPFETHFEPLYMPNVRPRFYSNVIEGETKASYRSSLSELKKRFKKDIVGGTARLLIS